MVDLYITDAQRQKIGQETIGAISTPTKLIVVPTRQKVCMWRRLDDIKCAK